MSRNSPPTPVSSWMMVVSTPVTNGTPRHSMFGRARAGNSSISERQQPEPEIDRRLARHDRDVAHDRERHHRARHIDEEDAPQHEAPPQHRAPAVRDELDDREDHHRGRDVEIDQQHADQDHPARHPEQAGDERGRDDGEADEGEGEGGHATVRVPHACTRQAGAPQIAGPPRFATLGRSRLSSASLHAALRPGHERCSRTPRQRAVDHADRVLHAIDRDERAEARAFLLAEQHLVEHVEPVERDAGTAVLALLTVSRNGSRRPIS